MRTIDLDRVAQILVEAAYNGDKDTAKRWGISERTIRRYRARMDDDDNLSLSVLGKKAAFEKDWADEIPAAITTAIQFLKEAATRSNPKDPDAIHAVAGALKILAEVGFTKSILDVRLDSIRGQNGTPSGQMDSGPRVIESGS